MTTIAQQIETLQTRFTAPSNVKFQSHHVQVAESQELLQIAPCCQAARSVLKSSVIACVAKNGVPGVIEYFTNKFSWGCFPCQYYCECFSHADELFCTGTMCVGLEALDIARAHCAAPLPFDLVTVELIIVQSKDVINSSKMDVADSRSSHPDKSISGEWLLADTMYHNVVGIVDRNLQLTICDYDAQFIFHYDKNLSEERIAAIRVCAWTGGDIQDSFLTSQDPKAAVKGLSWSGMSIPLGKWYSIPACPNIDANEDSAADPLSTLGSVYGDKKQHVDYLAPQADNTADISLKKRKFPDVDTSGGPVMVSMDSVESRISTDSLESLMPPAALAGLYSSKPPSDLVYSPPIVPAESGDICPKVLISGIYMGPNPCPGVGVARALRASYGDKVALIALDDAQFSDPVFDSLQQVFEMGSTLCSATSSKQRQWDTVARLLLEHLRDSGDTGAPFYIPGRDRDIEVTALGKTSIEAHLRAHSTIAAVGTTPWEPVAGQVSDASESLSLGALTGDGGGCIQVAPPSLSELMSLRNALLCPDAAVMELTVKPDIVAASTGPLGKYFRVPEYARLSATCDTRSENGIKPTAADGVNGVISDGTDGIVTSTSTTSLTSPESTAESRAGGNMSLLEMRAFAERIGYPVLVKGPNQGAALCSSWFQLRHLVTTAKWVQNGGFIQRHTRGWEKCLAFAAFEGKLSGCVMMTKASYTDSGKVWSGDLEPVPAELYTALVEFVRRTRWTGGGEIEFIEEVVPGLDLSFDTSTHADNAQSSSELFIPRSSVPLTSFRAGDVPLCSKQDCNQRADHLPARWVVDFNPRFPAWIFASAYSGCNLPALLLQDALRAAEVKRNSNQSLLHVCSAMSLTSISANSSAGTAEATDGNSAVRASFVRSVIEIPVVHTLHQRNLPLQPTVMQPSKMKASANKDSGREYKYNVLPQAVRDFLLDSSDATAGDALGDLSTVVQDLHRLTTAVEALPLTDQVEWTPKYVLSVPTLEHTLLRLAAAIKSSRDTALANIVESTSVLPAAQATQPDLLHVQMCLSVKTQPNTLLLQAAERAGYMAECIDLAEVYHSVIDGGFPWDRVVLTGPGKWWDCKSAAERAVELQSLEMGGNHSVGVHKFHVIFADSLVDLREIVRRLLDPSDWLDTEVVGIRWVPLWGPSSRFGLNCKDVLIVRQAAELIRQLPSQYRLGMHFHHACSALGAEQWFGLAKGFSVFCSEFAALCGRAVATVDFGGGFEPHFLETAHAQRQLTSLFKCVYHSCVQRDDNDHHAVSPVCVQFELGKSVSEQAGGVLSRILSIREREDYSNKKAEGPLVTSDGEAEDHTPASIAVIVDTTVADISTPNSHAVFWIQAPPVSMDSGTIPSQTPGKCKCIPLAAGRAEIWGRTCMEWDKIPGSFDLPVEAREGDLLLISGCGAYDMSMQYDFGDGVGRSRHVIVL